MKGFVLELPSSGLLSLVCCFRLLASYNFTVALVSFPSFVCKCRHVSALTLAFGGAQRVPAPCMSMEKLLDAATCPLGSIRVEMLAQCAFAGNLHLQ